MFQIQMEDVINTYCGSGGCACGCGGTYAYPESTSKPGYFVEGNPTTTKKRVNRMNKALAEQDPAVKVLPLGKEILIEMQTSSNFDNHGVVRDYRDIRYLRVYVANPVQS
jgi:hypothetical protein